ncbi:MAG: universal stress protein [Desulfococcaceae bacterium]|jgi:nucleotide-binding universal stress UspA family protein|nr:universal stress protein [Desulfococcaceae bacterium]
MGDNISKMVVIPLDGTGKSLQSVHYLDKLFGSGHPLQVALLYIMPSLPPFLVENRMKDVEIAKEFKAVREENDRIAGEILEQGKKLLLTQGYAEESIKEIRYGEKLGIAGDICMWAENERADAILLHSRGLTKLEGFFMGQVTMKLLECCHTCPVWVMKGNPVAENVLIPVDMTDRGYRAADHAGFMLKGTDRKITLFHSKQALDSFVPKALLSGIPRIRAMWSDESGKNIGPFMKKSREILIDAGIPEENIREKIRDGSGRPDKDIMKEARESNCGTIVFGRQPPTCDRDFAMGSIALRVLENTSDITVWVV